MRSLLVALVIVIGGCGGGGSKPRVDAPKPTRQLPRFLDYIPANAPYLMVALEPMPREYYTKMFDVMGPTFATKMREAAIGKPDMAAMMAAIRGELDGKWNAAGLESIGLSTAPRFAVYGIGPVFVARLELRDQNKLLAAVRRIAAAWGKPMPPPQTRGTTTYWKLDETKSSTVIALAHGELVVAFGKTARIDAELDVILGDRKPAQSYGDGIALNRLMDRHHLGPYLVGIMETANVIDMVVTGPTPVSAACQAQLVELGRLVPRFVFGHSQVSAKQFSGGLIVELAPSIARDLRELRTAVPGVAALIATDSIFTFGGGIDFAAARGLTQRGAAAVATLATACESGPLHEVADALDRAAAKWIPSPFDALTGFVIAVHDVAPGKNGSKVPERLQAIALVASTNATQLFNTFAAIPMVASLGIEVDGAMHEIAAGLTPFGISAGVNDKAIIVAAGNKDALLAERLIAEKPDKDAPFLAMSYDYARLVTMERVFNIPAQDPAMEDAMAKLFGHGTATVDIADDGLVLWSTIDLK